MAEEDTCLIRKRQNGGADFFHLSGGEVSYGYNRRLRAKSTLPLSIATTREPVSGEALIMTIPFAGFFFCDPHSQVCSAAHLSRKLPAGGKVSLHQVSLQISAYRFFLQICHLHLLLKALRGLSLRKENLFFI